ncbi:MAG: hypothetical protein ABI914_05475 [Acidobacteriota bacterium]
MQWTFRPIAVAAAGLLLAGAALAQWDGGAHWKSAMTIEGGPQAVPEVASEIWLQKDGRMRMKSSVMGINMNTITAGDTVYQWTEGGREGMKINSVAAGRPHATGDYARRILEYRTKGHKIGAEAVDGHRCEIYELVTPAEGAQKERKEKVWLATDLKNFPVKVVVETSGMTMTSLNSEVQLNASVPDGMVTVPADIQFRDMSEMIKQGRPPGQ